MMMMIIIIIIIIIVIKMIIIIVLRWMGKFHNINLLIGEEGVYTAWEWGKFRMKNSPI